jgi:hypothetical protein
MKRLITVFIVLLAFMGSLLAHENQVRIFSFGSKPLNGDGKLNWRLQVVFPNIVAAHSPLVYSGPELSFGEKFTLAVMVGNLFKKDELDLKASVFCVYESGRLFLCSQADYSFTPKNIWNISQLRYFIVGDMWIGVESESTLFGDEEEKYLRYSSVGPCIGARINKKICINATYFRKWAPRENGENWKNFGVFRFYLILNLNEF